MVPERGRFRRSDRLRSPKDFRRVGREGVRRASGYFVVLSAPRFQGQLEDPSRLGVTVSRKVGNAVVRNRVKRSIREWFRSSRDAIAPGKDLVVIARRPAADLVPVEVARRLSRMLT